MSSPKSIKSNSSTSSIKSDISTLSEDSFRAGNKLTTALTNLLDEDGIFTIRKQVSHDAKKLDPAKTPAKNVKFENGSDKLNRDYYAYKAEVDRIKPLKDAYKLAQTAAKKSTETKPHENCIAAATSWKNQAVKAGSMRIKFLKDHQQELTGFLTIKSTTDHIKQGELNLKSANTAFLEIQHHEKKIIELSKGLGSSK